MRTNNVANLYNIKAELRRINLSLEGPYPSFWGHRLPTSENVDKTKQCEIFLLLFSIIHTTTAINVVGGATLPDLGEAVPQNGGYVKRQNVITLKAIVIHY